MNGRELKFLFIITIIFVAACIETDIYLPAFPDMMAYFSVSEEAIQSLLTWNFFGICVSGLLYGPISDSIGRKKPLIVALGLFLVGSIITLFAQNFDLMLVGRLLQGLGSGGCFTLGTAILFDAFQAEKAILAMNQLNTIIPFIMAAAPVLGGYLNNEYGFRSNFFAIAALVLLSCIICLFAFEETLPKEKRTPLRLRKMGSDFKLAFTSLPFLQMTLVVSLLFAGYLTFLSLTAVLFVIEFGVSKQVFPYFQAAILGAWVLGNLTSSKAIAKWGIFKVKMAGSALLLAGGLGFLLCALLFQENPYVITGFMLLYAVGANWTMGLYFTEGMEVLPEIKGVTASILTSARLLITALVVALAGKYYDGTIFPVVAVVSGVVFACLPLIFSYERGQKKSPKASQSSSSRTVHLH